MGGSHSRIERTSVSAVTLPGIQADSFVPIIDTKFTSGLLDTAPQIHFEAIPDVFPTTETMRFWRCLPSQNTIEHEMIKLSGKKMTASSCLGLCDKRGYDFVQLEQQTCYCRNWLWTEGPDEEASDRLAKLASETMGKSSLCMTPCPGNESEACAGNGFRATYFRQALPPTQNKSPVLQGTDSLCWKEKRTSLTPNVVCNPNPESFHREPLALQNVGASIRTFIREEITRACDEACSIGLLLCQFSIRDPTSQAQQRLCLAKALRCKVLPVLMDNILAIPVDACVLSEADTPRTRGLSLLTGERSGRESGRERSHTRE
jgi:hypothetical protein